MGLTRRLHLTIVLPLLVVSAVVGVLTARGLSTNSRHLDEALTVEARAHLAHSLMLVQDNASRAILIDPNRLADYSEAKLQAYDAHKRILEELRAAVTDPADLAQLARVQEIDAERLRPLDTKILETLFEKPDAARRMYLDEFEPAQQEYGAVIGALVKRAQARSAEESDEVRERNLWSLIEIMGVLLLGIAAIAGTIQVLGTRVEVAQESLRSLLRGMESGLFYFERSGALSDQRSQALAELVPASTRCSTLFDLFAITCGTDEATVRSCLDLLWCTPSDFYSPFEATVAFLPQEIRRREGDNERVVRLSYRPQYAADGATLLRIYVTASDVTDQLRAEQDAARVQERVHRITVASACTESYVSFQSEMGHLLDAVERELRAALAESAHPLTDLKRHLHTIKGSAAMVGFRNLSRRVHAMEDVLASEVPTPEVAAAFVDARAEWEIEARDVREVLGLRAGDAERRVNAAKIRRLAEVAAGGSPQLLDAVAALERKPIGDLLSMHRRYLLDLATRREDPAPPDIVFDADSAEVTPAEAEQVEGILGHLLRNAYDHGIEVPNERERSGKRPYGTIRVRAARRPDGIVWSVQDDGRGIPVEVLVRKAVAGGDWTASRALAARWEEKVALVFRPGLSSKEEVSLTSGRGIGLYAVAQQVRALGGRIDVETAPGVGTSWTVALPEAA